jgi:citrate synthase
MEEDRKTAFAARLRTRIWQELPDESNPWRAREARCHGYSLTDMIATLDYPQTLFLLLRGELPTVDEQELLRRYLIAFCNPGPRHAATRGTMSAAASGTQTNHLGSIGLALLGGNHLGSGEVEQAVAFLTRNRGSDPETLADACQEQTYAPATECERRIAPGFGTLFGERDEIAAQIALQLQAGSSTWRTLQESNRSDVAG